ncbi:MAG: hypothetical protein ABSF18_06245 [Gammaproteobacteria bacterium]|jgi:hypothetical protein
MPGWSLENLKKSYYESISGVSYDQLSDYDQFDDEVKTPRDKYPSILVPYRKRTKGKYRPLTSSGALNTYLGLNQSHVPLVILTIENWHNTFLHNGYEGEDNLGYWQDLGLSMGVTIMSPWAAIPIALYVALTLWYARSVIQKNIVYNENRIKYLTALQKSKTNVNEQMGYTFSVINHLNKTKINDEAFRDKHQPLLDFNEVQLKIDPPKKFFRAVLIFGILFLVILPPSWVILATLLCAAIVTRFDYKALNTELNKDIAIKKLQWELITFQNEYIAALNKKRNIIFAPINDADKTTYDIPDHPTLDNHKVSVDRFFTRLGMNSGYMGFSMITLFGLHNLMLGGGLVSTIFVFALPAIICISIGVYHAIQNDKLYNYYADEIYSLKRQNAQLMKDLAHLRTIVSHTLTDSDKILAPQKELIVQINNESKAIYKYFEAIKKVVRPWQFFGLFGLFGVILATGMATGGIIALVAVFVVASIIMGYADYKTRAYKESLEGDINSLKESQINLLNEKRILLEKAPIPQPTSASLPADTRASPSSTSAAQPIAQQNNNATRHVQPGSPVTEPHGFEADSPRNLSQPPQDSIYNIAILSVIVSSLTNATTSVGKKILPLWGSTPPTSPNAEIIEIASTAAQSQVMQTTETEFMFGYN